MSWRDGPLLGLDFETTGVDPTSDLPVQVALVAAEGPGEAVTAEVFLVDPGREIPAGAVAVHGISTERARAEGCSLAETADRVHAALSAAERAGVPVVAMNASFDVTIAAVLFEWAGLPALAWQAVVDPLVIDRRVARFRKGNRRLDSLCEHYGIELTGAHDAGQDATAAVALARELGRRYPEVGELDARELTVREREWHRAWATDYDAWARKAGRRGLEPEEWEWPVRPRAARG